MGKRIDTVINPNGTDMGKFGHIELSVAEEELKSVFDFGDILKVTIAGIGVYVMPFFPYYDEVGIGELVLCTYTKHSTAVIARNYRSFGVEIGLLKADTKYSNFSMKDGYNHPLSVVIELEGKAEKQPALCFAGQENRGSHLYDFRMISGGQIRENILFRSSSPVDIRLTDSAAVDKRAKETGIRSLINLADTREEAEHFPNFWATYCSRCKTAYLNMPLDVTSRQFQKSICEGFSFIAESEPPYLIFCSEGRDRTGLFVALLQCLCGVGPEDIMSGYIYSFQMFCSENNTTVLHNSELSLKNNLCSVLGMEKFDGTTLESDTEKFLLSIGIGGETLTAVRNKIGVQQL